MLGRGLALMDKCLNLCFWNLRGLNHPLKQASMREVMVQHHCGFGGFLETRLKGDKFIGIKAKLESCWQVDSNVGLSKNCRILLVWDQSLVNVTVEKKHEQYIHCLVQSKDLQWRCYVTVVYGLNLLSQRVTLWQDLAEIGDTMVLPWLVAGDLNVVKDSTEKWSESLHMGQVGTELVDVMTRCNILDHRYVGPVYTWTNSHVVFCKLDRVMVNQMWMSMNKESTVQFFPPGVSDHAYSVTQVFHEEKHKGVPFRFKNIWVLDENFMKIVTEVWDSKVYVCYMFQLV